MTLALGLGLGLPFTRSTGVSYDADASALFARFTTPPTTVRKALINDLIVSLKDAGVWAKLDVLYVMAAADSQAARQNWIEDAFNATAINSPAFAADRGYTGDGSSSYLDSGFNPATASGLFAQNSAHVGVWCGTNVSEDRDDAGNSSNVLIRPRSTSNTISARVNQASSSNTSGTITTSVGHSVATRPDSANIQIAKDGASVAGISVASTALASANIWFCRGLAGYSTKQLSVGHLGAALTSDDLSALYTALETYLTAVGAA